MGNWRATAKMNKSLNTIAGMLAQDEDLRQLLFYPGDTYDETLGIVTKKEVFDKCIDIVAKYPDYMESIGAFLVVGIPEFHTNASNSSYMDVVITIDVMIHEDSEKFGIGLRALEIVAVIDYLLNEKDIQGIGRLKLKDGFFQPYTPIVKGYTMVFSNRDMN